MDDIEKSAQKVCAFGPKFSKMVRFIKEKAQEEGLRGHEWVKVLYWGLALEIEERMKVKTPERVQEEAENFRMALEGVVKMMERRGEKTEQMMESILEGLEKFQHSLEKKAEEMDGGFPKGPRFSVN